MSEVALSVEIQDFRENSVRNVGVQYWIGDNTGTVAQTLFKP